MIIIPLFTAYAYNGGGGYTKTTTKGLFSGKIWTILDYGNVSLQKQRVW